MSPLLCALLLAAAASGQIKVASPSLSGVNLTEKEATFYSDHFAAKLALSGLRVTTSSEIHSLIGLERQKQLLGCAEDTEACLAELANALGVDAIIQGSIGKFGNKYQVNIKIVSASDAKQLAIFSGEFEGEDVLLTALTKAARPMALQVKRNLGRATDKDLEDLALVSSGGLRAKSWIPAVAGGAFALAGGGLFYSAKLQYDQLDAATPGTMSIEDGRKLADQGKMTQTLGLAASGLAVAGLATAAIFFLSGDGTDSVIAFVPNQNGGAVAITGGFP